MKIAPFHFVFGSVWAALPPKLSQTHKKIMFVIPSEARNLSPFKCQRNDDFSNNAELVILKRGIYISTHCSLAKNNRFFTSFRMTDYYILFVGVLGRLAAKPPIYPTLKT